MRMSVLGPIWSFFLETSKKSFLQALTDALYVVVGFKWRERSTGKPNVSPFWLNFGRGESARQGFKLIKDIFCCEIFSKSLADVAKNTPIQKGLQK